MFIGFIFSMSSCTTLYIPNTQNVTLFEEKNELQIYGGAAMGESSFGGDIQAAYSVTNHLAIGANGFFGTTHNDNAYQVGEIALGYFTPLGKSKGIFEVYGGWGAGGNKHLEGLHFNHFFIQPNVGAHLGAIDLAFSTRFNYAVWPKSETVSVKEELYIEPAMTFRLGSDKAKFQLQILYSFPTSDPYLDDVLNSFIDYQSFDRIHLSAGFFIPLDLNKK